MNVAELRAAFMEEPEARAAASVSAARAVRAGTCTCCPGDGDVTLGCGHKMCDHCYGNDHGCIACALMA